MNIKWYREGWSLVKRVIETGEKKKVKEPKRERERLSNFVGVMNGLALDIWLCWFFHTPS